MRVSALAILACAAAAGCSGSDTEDHVTAEVVRAAETIEEAGYLEKVGQLAHDSMRGRATGSIELERAAVWIGDQFADLELDAPFGDDYLQWYDVRGIDAPNAAAILRGRDAALSEEYIVFSAHMDHVGVGQPDESGDSIYNGADDDASGTAAVLELAEAFASLSEPPRRSIIFLLVSGEEQGLFGSAHFTGNPPVPIESIVANVNADMLGRNWTDRIVAIGKDHSDLGETLELVAEAHPELNMRPIDDPWPEENFYRRSDHYNFAVRGVPVLFLFNGVHDDYHRPSDAPELIDGEKAARIARLMFYTGMTIAEREDRPQWNRASYERIVTLGSEGNGR